ncbi:SDR family NAD(P)-dependent oxidoreductase [Pseudonocardia sp. NPDC046786]|uniref:SDR family NAD(P)-dependent oxidoreductase n=1 Tax=Pseudonocardia sp. NPDC046786 TaxID=3155471 RepID=UPI0033DC1209
MPTALITGGSRGLGETYARELAERGYSVVLVAREPDRLAVTAERIGRATGAIVEILAADLTDLTGPAGLAAVERRIADPDLPVRLLVQAARCAPGGPVTGPDPYPEVVLRLVRAAVTAMTGPAPVPATAAGRRRPGILLVDGGNGGRGGPLPDLAVLRSAGVPVTAVAVGPESPDPRTVVRRSLADAGRGRARSVPGRARRMLAGCREPRRTALRLAARVLPAGGRQPGGPAVTAAGAAAATTGARTAAGARTVTGARTAAATGTSAAGTVATAAATAGRRVAERSRRDVPGRSGRVTPATPRYTRPSPVPTPFRGAPPAVRSLPEGAPAVLPERPVRPVLAPVDRPARRRPATPVAPAVPRSLRTTDREAVTVRLATG